MTSRRLRLRYEGFVDLTTDELHAVPGASGTPCEVTRTVTCTELPYTVAVTGCQCTALAGAAGRP